MKKIKIKINYKGKIHNIETVRGKLLRDVLEAEGISYLFPYITRALLMDDGEIIKEYTADEIGALSEEDLEVAKHGITYMKSHLK